MILRTRINNAYVVVKWPTVVLILGDEYTYTIITLKPYASAETENNLHV